MMRYTRNVQTKLWPKIRQNAPIKYRLVLDIDATMCCTLSTSTDRKWIAENFPHGELIHWKGTEYEYLHFFYPNFEKLLLSILSWDGWSVDIFSAGIAERNDEIISRYFIKKFAAHTTNPHELYQNLIESGRIRIFSRDHLIDGERDYKGYEQYGQKKKDLSVIDKDVSNVVIADDDRSYILGSQYPFIALSYSASSNLESAIRRKDIDFLKTTTFNPMKNAEYIMGIIIACKEKLDNNKAGSLRGALDLVLQHNGQSFINDMHLESPWFIEPTRELFESRNSNALMSRHYHTKMTEWIDSGSEYFNTALQESLKKDEVQELSETKESSNQKSHREENKGVPASLASKRPNVLLDSDLDDDATSAEGQQLSLWQQPIHGIAEHYVRYCSSGINVLLPLRIKNAELSDIAILKASFLNANTILDLLDVALTRIHHGFNNVALPLNIQEKHWVGMLIKKKESVLEITYLDSENAGLSQNIKDLIVNFLSETHYNINLIEAKLEQQKYGNCDPELIENFIKLLTGTRVSQEEAVIKHSKLFEQSLLSGDNLETTDNEDSSL